MAASSHRPHPPPPSPPSGRYTPVYSVCVHGSRLFCGLQSGHIQQWQCPLNAPATALEWRAHSATVYSLLVVGRLLVSASRDGMLRVWELHALTLVATLAGHRDRVRALATSHPRTPYRLFSGSNDRTVRVWDLLAKDTGGAERKVLSGHRNWVRSLACCAGGEKLCSAAKEVRVWDTTTLKLLYVLPVGDPIYSLAVCKVSAGVVERDTLYAGSTKGRVLSWRLGDRATMCGELRGHDGKIRALAVNKAVLYSGATDGKLRAWDLQKSPTPSRQVVGHTAGVRTVTADPISHSVFSASDDRTIRMWCEPEA